MLLSELITELQYRLEDDSINSRFPEVQKIDAINNAYYSLLSIMDDKDLSKFKLTSTGISLTTDNSSHFQYARIDNNAPLRVMNAYDESNRIWCTITDKDTLFSYGNNYRYGTVISVCKTYTPNSDITVIYATPSSVGSVTLWHIQEVDGMRTTDQYPVTDVLRPVILGMAESELWRSDNASTRAKEAYSEAINILSAQEKK